MAPRKGNVPLSKVLESLNDALKGFNSVLLKCDPDEVRSELLSLRSKLSSGDDEKKKLSPALVKIISELQNYPGFQADILNDLKSRISSAEKLGIIDSYKSEIAVSKKKKVAKPKEQDIEKTSA